MIIIIIISSISIGIIIINTISSIMVDRKTIIIIIIIIGLILSTKGWLSRMWGSSRKCNASQKSQPIMIVKK